MVFLFFFSIGDLVMEEIERETCKERGRERDVQWREKKRYGINKCGIY